ncbi:UDP-2,3-diacylglucosamine diphosphatase [Thiocapsa roseopersicina]|uniref:UDP-2,3-diacylglucosamine pyrophosphatase LpxH n=1 Tax=Thiocapsa roseopersicina TaxID=1058 RepID=A0A1H2YRZ3_THIRO|nr:UDP-2,3-diacylglucosamine diphosphatase [Thiocapsa roseopersicina]SDX07568.1 UDP-2,3-diacylglucosamine pyrophosphatase LpxH [Thiocapsa roseopersicina]
MTDIKRMNPLKYRSIFISDVHLGFRGCQASLVLDFLQSTECKQLYLVGDIVDIWAMKNGVYWPEAHNQVVREVLDKAKRGTEVIYTPGNHDELFRTHLGADFGNVAVREEVIHTTADGRRFLVMHGDAFDAVVQNGKWLAMIGSRAYDGLLMLNGLVSRIRRVLGLEYWSLAGYLKHKVKNAVSYIGNFEAAVAGEAERRRVDGMICGHIHHAEMREIAGVAYCNCGDWVESCTALVEHHDGRLELLRWTDAYPQPASIEQDRLALARVG